MSLKQRLVMLLLLSFSLLWSVSAYWLFVDLSKQMQHTLDQRLAASARMVAGLLQQLPQGWQQNSSAVVLADLPSVACEISLQIEQPLKTRNGKHAERAKHHRRAQGSGCGCRRRTQH